MRATGTRVPRAAAPLLLAAALLVSTGSLGAQEPTSGSRSPAAGEDLPPDSITGQHAVPNRPPPRPPFDGVDALALPVRIVAFPFLLLGTGVGELAGLLQEVQPSVQDALVSLARLGLRPSVGSIGPRSGVAAQIGYYKLEPVFLETAFSTRRSQRHRAGIRLADENAAATAHYTFQRNGQIQFWGIGSSSRERDVTDFLWDLSEFSAAGRLRVSRLVLGAGAAFEDNRVGRGFDDGTNDLQDVVDADTLFGVRERTNYFRFETSAALDLTNVYRLQRRGVYLSLGGRLYRGTDGTDSDFHRISASAHGYLPLNDRQSLAIQGLARINRGDTGRGVPFTHLAEVGDERGARAYPSGRFRHLDMAAVMAEWRYEIWRELHERARAEGFVFFDEGGVARRLDDLDASDLAESYGFGIRAVAGGQLLGLAYLAFGDEGARFQAAFSWAY